MRLTEERLKELFQSRPARSTPRRPECLTEEQFTRAATGELSKEERRDLARHLITCIDCTEDYRTLRSLQPWAEDACAILTPSSDSSAAPLIHSEKEPGLGSRWIGPSASRAGRSGLQRLRESFSDFWQRLIWERRAQAAAALVAILLVVGSSLVVWRAISHREPPTSTERAPVSTRPSVEPPDKATLSEPPDRLVWPAQDKAITYQVVLYDFQSTPVWESSLLLEPATTIPEPVRKQLKPNRPYYWRVITEDAIEQRQSDLFQFSIAAKEHR